MTIPMNLYVRIFCFLSLGITTTQYGMEKEIMEKETPVINGDLNGKVKEEMPTRYRNLNWKQDIHNLRNDTNLTQAEYNASLNDILDYAVVQYERKKIVP